MQPAAEGVVAPEAQGVREEGDGEREGRNSEAAAEGHKGVSLLTTPVFPSFSSSLHLRLDGPLARRGTIQIGAEGSDRALRTLPLPQRPVVGAQP